MLLDLCAAPGSWSQVAAEVLPPNSLILGVDLNPIKPIPRCLTVQADISTDHCRSAIRNHLKSWKADTVLHDGAPNVGTAWVQDAFAQAALVLQALRLATDFLIEGGTFVTKVFRSKDYNALLWVFNQLFAKVDASKPPSSRDVSAEMFVVCRGYKAPKHLDTRLVDPRAVFAELADPTPNHEAKVYKPEIKKRRREGYEEGDWTQFKEISVGEFVRTNDPIALLGSVNRFSFKQPPEGDITIATIDRLPDTTEEIRICCQDLKVLGRSDFKRLLRWRLRVRDVFGLGAKKKKVEDQGGEVVEVEPMDEEMQMQEDIERLKEHESKVKKKKRRHENESKRKDILRLEMHMTAPTELGMEQGEQSNMFALKPIDTAEAVPRIAKGKMATLVPEEEPEPVMEMEMDENIDTDEEEDQLERELDDMYEEYTERKASRDAKYRAKRARTEHGDDEWQGFSDREEHISSDDELVQDATSDDSDASDAETNNPRRLITDLEERPKTGLTTRAARFFDQDVFKAIDGLDDAEDEDSGIDVANGNSHPPIPSVSCPDQAECAEGTTALSQKAAVVEKTINAPQGGDSHSDGESSAIDGAELVHNSETPWEEESVPMRNGRPDIEIITAEAMTLAHQMATGKKTRKDLLDDSFNRYAFRDKHGLPDWFLDDEREHSQPNRPITAAAAAAIKEKLRALNARPIKKVREAKARKKYHAAQRLEKLKKKSALLADDDGLTEKEKALSIAKLVRQAGRKKPKQKTTVVVAKGSHRGIQGRPKGTKGRYKMVDRRLKKDARAEKRLAKQKK